MLLSLFFDMPKKTIYFFIFLQNYFSVRAISALCFPGVPVKDGMRKISLDREYYVAQGRPAYESSGKLLGIITNTFGQ